MVSVASPNAIETAAERLLTAYRTRQPCAAVRDLIQADDVDAAYAVQDINTRAWLAEGRRIVGRKIGLTSKAVQKQLGVDQPDFGILYADMTVADGEEVPLSTLMQPKVEAEIALVLDKPLTGERHTVADIEAATAYAVAAIEIVGSRVANWDIKIADTIADNASSGRYVLGTQRKRLKDFDVVNCTMEMQRAGEVVSSGSGAACLGSPLLAAVWLADAMAKHGRPLQAGDVVLTGALGPMVAVRPGDVFDARIEGLGPVRARFAAE
jgi:2-keto-4-pentenoate hydratase